MEYSKLKILKRIEVDSKSGCWLWQGHVSNKGYGKISCGSRRNGTKRVEYTHRYAYCAWFGSVPDGMTIDHVAERGCIHRHCVNPNHLEAVTIDVNLLRGRGWSGQNVRKTHCPQDHPYSGDNLIINGQGQRICRACRKVHSRNTSRRRRARLTSVATAGT